MANRKPLIYSDYISELSGTADSLVTGNLIITQIANGDDTLAIKRVTDTSPTGNVLKFTNNAGNTTLFNIDVAGSIHSAGTAFIGSTSTIQWGDGGTAGTINGFLGMSSNGVFRFGDSAGGGSPRIILGSATSSFVSILRNGTALDIKLGDNSGLADLNLREVLSGTWKGTAVGAAYGGTGQTSYTVGDTLYASGSSALSKLAGNTTTTKKFLSQTGDGTNSAAPSWGTLADSDIPTTLANKTLTSPVINVGSDATGDIYYRNSSGAFTRLAFTSNGDVLQLVGGVPTWQTLATGSGTVNAGTTNQLAYYTANAAIVSGLTLGGEFSISGSTLSARASSTSQTGIVQLTDSTSSTSTTTAATPNSVKTSYDLANAALPKAGGTMTGKITTVASGTSTASILLGVGSVDPTTPVSGDFWNNTGVLKFYNGSATKTIAYTDGTIANANNVGITDDTSTNATYYPSFSPTSSGNNALKVSSSKLTFNPSTGLLTATAFSGSGANLTSIPNSALTNSSITVSGTSNQVNVSGGSPVSLGGTVTLSLPQNVHSAATPQFAGLGLGQSAPSAGIAITGKTISTDTDGTVASESVIATFTKDNADTRTFAVTQIKPTLNTGASNANTTVNVLDIDTVNTSVTGLTVNLINAMYGGASRFVVSSAGVITSATWNGAVIGASYGGAGTVNGILKANGSGTVSSASAGTDYEVPLTFSTGLTRSTNTITVNTTQNIAKLSNLTSNGLVKTSGGDGTLGIATAGTDYVGAGAITSSGLTMATARLLGRTTASTGAVEEITVGSGLSLSSGSLTNSGVTALTGTSNQITVSGSTGSVTLSLPSAVTMPGSLTVTGDLIVNGTTTTVNSAVTTIVDPIIDIGGATGGAAPSTDDNKDRGILFQWHNGSAAKKGFFGFDDSTGYFTFVPDATNTSEVISGTKGTLDITSITGSAATLTTARAIALSGDISGTQNFDGSAGITISSTLATVNSNVGSFGDAITIPAITVNGKGLVTAVSTNTVRTGSTSQTGVLQITDSISSTSTSTAASPNSVKTAYDLANAALPKAGGTMTGKITTVTTSTSTANILLAGAAADPSAPASGDFWNNAGTLKFYNGSTTKTLAFTDSNISGSAGSVANTLTIGTNLSGTSYNGSSAVTIATVTNPSFSTSVTSPIIYGGTGASSTLTLAGTSNGSPANAYIILNGSGQGNVGIGQTTPTAALHIKAGTATAGTAPLKLTSGTALTTAEDGAIEYHSSHLYFTIGSTRYQLDQQGGGGTTINATDNVIPYRSNSSTFSDSPLYVSGTLLGLSATSPAAKFHVAGNLTASSWTTAGIQSRYDAATFTNSSSSGTVANIAVNAWAQPTLAASSSTTYTNASTLYVANAPAAGTNVTITNAYAFYAAAGNIAANGIYYALDSAVSTAMFSSNGDAGYVGTTSNTTFKLMTNNSAKWQIATGGSLTASTNNSYDFGSNSNAARDIYAARTCYAATSAQVGSTSSPNSTLQVSGSFATGFVTKTANYTATSSDHKIYVDSTSNTVTITLPTAVGCTGREYVIKDWKGTSETYNIVIACSNGELIDGSATFTINTNYDSVCLTSTNSGWGVD